VGRIPGVLVWTGLLQGTLQKGDALDPPAPHHPPLGQRGSEPERGRRIVVQRPGQPVVDRGVLSVQPQHRRFLAAADSHLSRGLLGHVQGVDSQRDRRVVLLVGLPELVEAKAAQRVEHQVPGPAIGPGCRRHQQRAVDQPQYRLASLGPGYGFGGVQGERARKYRQPPEHPLLGLAEQLVAPLDRGFQ